jgi:hypothetical protein
VDAREGTLSAEKGFAYESNGSVYFDVPTFEGDPNHKYAKLNKAALDDVELAMDGEVGLYKLNSLDPQLESAWFQPLKPIKINSNTTGFKVYLFNSTCTATARARSPRTPRRRRTSTTSSSGGGCVQV